MFTIKQGDITQFKGEAIVNAANSELQRGGGVCGAIFSAAGSRLDEACEKIGHCEVGNAVVTKSFELDSVNFIIHAVAPRYGIDRFPKEALISAYKKSCDIAFKLGLSSIAFPLLGCGIYNYPLEEGMDVAISTLYQASLKYHIDIALYGYTEDIFNSLKDKLSNYLKLMEDEISSLTITYDAKRSEHTKDGIVNYIFKPYEIHYDKGLLGNKTSCIENWSKSLFIDCYPDLINEFDNRFKYIKQNIKSNPAGDDKSTGVEIKRNNNQVTTNDFYGRLHDIDNMSALMVERLINMAKNNHKIMPSYVKSPFEAINDCQGHILMMLYVSRADMGTSNELFVVSSKARKLGVNYTDFSSGAYGFDESFNQVIDKIDNLINEATNNNEKTIVFNKHKYAFIKTWMNRVVIIRSDYFKVNASRLLTFKTEQAYDHVIRFLAYNSDIPSKILFNCACNTLDCKY